VLPQIRIAISERSEVGAARRVALELSESHGFDETQAGKVGLCVTEAATNIVKHAGSGHIVLRVMERALASGSGDPRAGGPGTANIGMASAEPVGAGIATYGIEILALDRGPGIANFNASLRDGVSTAGSPGNGLGALARLSENFDVYAPLGRGSAMRMEVWAQPPSTAEIEVGAICLAKSGETVSGDAWALASARGRHTFLVADGLGHGTEAARASHAALRVLQSRSDEDPSQIIEACHRALAPTRGAAVAVGTLIPGEEKGSFAGVGNIACRVEIGETRRQLVSHNGTLGHNMRRVQQFDFVLPPAALLIFHSDGLATHWNLADYPGLAGRHPGVIAGVLCRDHERGRDDVTVLVIRHGTAA
jgi:anti-sigma regulatory factor (Ser/Thr protein kinase)